MLDVVGEAHKGLAYLSLLLSLAWIAVVLTANPASKPTPAARIVYAACMASTGLLALAGLWLVYVGGWLGTAFPWIGFIVVAFYSFVGAISRRALAGGRKTEALTGSAVMLALLLFAYAIMVMKPI